jgi:hypothetical protein
MPVFFIIKREKKEGTGFRGGGESENRKRKKKRQNKLKLLETAAGVARAAGRILPGS